MAVSAFYELMGKRNKTNNDGNLFGDVLNIFRKKEKPEDIKRLKKILGEMHELFISHVKKTRGDKLIQNDNVFTGEIWLGESAKELGLIDGIGHLETVMKEKLGEKTRIKIYGQKKSFLQRFGVKLINETEIYLEERAAFARFGL